MKNLLFILAIFSICNSNAQNIKQGDNLKEEFKKLGNPYYFKAPGLTSWIEGTDMLLIGEKSNPNECKFLFIALHDTTLIGVFITSEPNTFIMDTEGNSILSDSSNYFLLPLWCVKNKAKIIPNDKTIISVLDKMYEQTLQANNGQLDEKIGKIYQRFRTDTTLANRHIALLFDNYQNLITKTAAKGEKSPSNICIPLMKSLAGECLSEYNSIPVIICIYMGEALVSAGMINEARSHFKMSLQFYPNSIPLLVYNYRLEPDPIKQKEELMDLKKNYSKHWMVKDL